MLLSFHLVHKQGLESLDLFHFYGIIYTLEKSELKKKSVLRYIGLQNEKCRKRGTGIKINH